MLVSNDIIHRSSHQKPKLASASCHCVFRISVTFNGNNTMKYFLNNSVTTSTIKLKLLIINQTLMAPFSSILFFQIKGGTKLEWMSFDEDPILRVQTNGLNISSRFIQNEYQAIDGTMIPVDWGMLITCPITNICEISKHYFQLLHYITLHYITVQYCTVLYSPICNVSAQVGAINLRRHH